MIETAKETKAQLEAQWPQTFFPGGLAASCLKYVLDQTHLYICPVVRSSINFDSSFNDWSLKVLTKIFVPQFWLRLVFSMSLKLAFKIHF